MIPRCMSDNPVTVYILIANKYSSEYDATNKEIEVNVDVDNYTTIMKSNKKECPKFKLSGQTLLLEHSV